MPWEAAVVKTGLGIVASASGISGVGTYGQNQAGYARKNKVRFRDAVEALNSLVTRASDMLNGCPQGEGFEVSEFIWFNKVKRLIDEFESSKIAKEIPPHWSLARKNIEEFQKNNAFKNESYEIMPSGLAPEKMYPNSGFLKYKAARVGEKSTEFFDRAQGLDKEYNENLAKTFKDNTLYKTKPHCRLPPDYEKERFINFPCRSGTKDKILTSLKEHGVTLIHGPGGIGKTTMLSQIAETAEKDGLFERVVYAKVKKDPGEAYIQEIQLDIATQLGVTLPSPRSSVVTAVGRSADLKKKIAEFGKVLVILDDVWEGFEMTTIGIPSIPPAGVKVLIGSRMSCLSLGAGSKILVEVLTDDDSRSLLVQEAPLAASIEPTLAKQVQDECCGLPLALAVIGKTLSGKEERHWEIAAKYLKNSNPACDQLKGVEKKLYQTISYSYEQLENVINERVFLCCCLFQESQVHAVDLKRYLARDEVCQDVQSYENSEDEVQEAAERLEQCGLLKNNIRTRGTVIMHDVVRDVGVYIARKEKYAIINWDAKKKFLATRLTECKRVSLSNIEVTGVMPNCPELMALLIRGNTDLPKLYLWKMVKSLAVLDLSYSDIFTLPSFPDNLPVQTLLLNGCRNLKTVDQVVKLSKLGELSLRQSVVQLLPKDMVLPTLLDWEDSSPEADGHPAVTSKHVPGQLKELSIYSRYLTDEAYQEITGFKNLEAVKLYVTDSALYSDRFDAEKTSKWKKFTIYNHVLCPQVSQEKHLSIMDLEEVPAGVKVLLKTAEEVVINHCFHKATMSEEKPIKGAKTVLVLTEVTGEGTFKETKILRLMLCPNISYLTSKDGAALTELVEMELTGLKEFLGIFKPLESADTDIAFFEKVRKIAVASCDKMESVVPNELLQRVRKTLEVISVKSSKKVKYIFHPEANSSLPFSKLRSIQVDNLEMLECIWQGIPSQETFEKLNELILRNCNKFTSLFTTHMAAQLKNLHKLTLEGNSGLTEIVSADDADTPSSVQAFQSVTHPKGISPQGTFQELKEVTVRKCNKLTSLFTSHLAAKLKNLQKLTVEGNSGLTEIISGYGTDAELTEQAFPRVTHLSLQELPILKRFSSKEVDFAWPILVKLELGACPDLKSLPIGSVSAPLMKMIHLASVNHLAWYEELVSQADENKKLDRFEKWINNKKHDS